MQGADDAQRALIGQTKPEARSIITRAIEQARIEFNSQSVKDAARWINEFGNTTTSRLLGYGRETPETIAGTGRDEFYQYALNYIKKHQDELMHRMNNNN